MLIQILKINSKLLILYLLRQRRSLLRYHAPIRYKFRCVESYHVWSAGCCYQLIGIAQTLSWSHKSQVATIITTNWASWIANTGTLAPGDKRSEWEQMPYLQALAKKLILCSRILLVPLFQCLKNGECHRRSQPSQYGVPDVTKIILSSHRITI